MNDRVRARLSAEQRRTWALGHDNDAFASQVVQRVSGDVAAAWQRALDAVAARHEVLRTRFIAPAGFDLPRQEIEPQPVAGLLGVCGGDADVERECRRERAAVTAQSDQVPWRFALVPAGDYSIVIGTAASWCADLRTVRLVVAEVIERCAFCEGVHEAAPVAYREYAEWRSASPVPRGGRREPAPFGYLPFRRAHEQGLPLRIARTPVPDLPDLAALSRAASQVDATLADLLCACWQVVTWRLSRQDRFVMARGHDGRVSPALRSMLGPFVTARPLEAVLDAHADLRSVAEEVRAQWALRAADGAPPIDAVPAPLLFDHIDCLDGGSGRSPCPEILDWWTCTEPFEVALQTAVISGRLSASLLYDDRTFDAAAIALFAAPLAALLEEPDRWTRAIGGVDLTRARAPRSVVHAGRDAQPELVHLRVEACAAAAPDQVAVVCGDDSLTYRDLSRRSTALAASLRAAGVGPEVVVPVLIDRSIDAVVAILAVLKAAGAYAPFDPVHTAPWLKQAVSSASLLLTTRAFAPMIDGTRLLVDGPADEPPPDRAGAAAVLQAENLAYVLFTSGTTGMPKGVAVEHRQLASYVDALINQLGLQPGWRFAMTSTFATDLAHTAIFPTLCTGGTLHLVPDDLLLDAVGMAAYVRAHAIDGLKMTPSHWHALASAAPGGPLLPKRHLVLGGEVCGWDQVDLAGAGECRVFNEYGPTETTVGVVSHKVEWESPRYSSSVPVGVPLSGVVAIVATADWRNLPRGEIGELFIAGRFVSRGYLESPARTAERFLPDPFGDEPGARMYCTGDRARWLPDGRLECLGRTDGQVKIRGFRTELGEVEAALRSHPAVRQAVVVPVTTPRHDTALVAFAVLHHVDAAGAVGPAIENQLRASLAARLPPHAVPTFRWLPALPLERSGKVDRRALASTGIPADTAAQPSPHARPDGDIERALAAVWSEVLGGRRVGRDDDFFEMGGQSLLAIRLLARVGAVFARSIAPKALFDAPTIGAFARGLDDSPATRDMARSYLASRGVPS